MLTQPSLMASSWMPWIDLKMSSLMAASARSCVPARIISLSKSGSCSSCYRSWPLSFLAFPSTSYRKLSEQGALIFVISCATKYLCKAPCSNINLLSRDEGVNPGKPLSFHGNLGFDTSVLTFCCVESTLSIDYVPCACKKFTVN